MTKQIIDSRWLWAGSVAIALTSFGLVHLIEDVVLAYPLDQWRVDLDDLITSIAALVVAGAAWTKAHRGERTAKDAMLQANGNGEKVEAVVAQEHELEQREETDYQLLRQEMAELRAGGVFLQKALEDLVGLLSELRREAQRQEEMTINDDGS